MPGIKSRGIMRTLFRVLSLASFIACSFSSCDPVFAATKTPAKDITTNASAFTKNLSSSDTDVQKALATIDQLGVEGPQGPQGDPGPNLVGSTTSTDLTGILKGNGATVTTASASTDYVVPDDLSSYSKIDGSTDFTGEPSVKKNFTAGEALTAGNICYLKSDGKFWKARGNAEATTKGRIVMALASISANASGQFLVRGYYTDSGLTAGATYFISTSTAGAKATTAPSSGNFARVVGWAMSTTSFYFDPSNDYIEVA